MFVLRARSGLARNEGLVRGLVEISNKSKTALFMRAKGSLYRCENKGKLTMVTAYRDSYLSTYGRWRDMVKEGSATGTTSLGRSRDIVNNTRSVWAETLVDTTTQLFVLGCSSFVWGRQWGVHCLCDHEVLVFVCILIWICGRRHHNSGC